MDLIESAHDQYRANLRMYRKAMFAHNWSIELLNYQISISEFAQDLIEIMNEAFVDSGRRKAFILESGMRTPLGVL